MALNREDNHMSTNDDLEAVIGECQRALDEFVKGNPEPMQEMFTHRDDVSLANPFGPPARGWDEVARTMERAASNLREGGMIAFEEVAKYVTPELAYTVWLERQKAKLGGREDITPFTLRVTMIYRPEGDTWKVVHRHADPISTARPPESVIQE
jgi:ketosteroid isomerase-like protein